MYDKENNDVLLFKINNLFLVNKYYYFFKMIIKFFLS